MIIHLSISEFSSAVAIASDPSLLHTPFVIAQGARDRALVLSPSPVAKREGIARGMRLTHAQLIIPSLRVIEPDHRLLLRAQEAIGTIVQHYTPSVAESRNGSFFLDMNGTTRLFGPVIDSAARLRSEIHASLGFDGSVAVAPNTLVANVATRTIAPSGLAAISVGQESSFLHPQLVTLLPGVGAKIASLLHAANITHIGELAALDESQVQAFLGPKGMELHRRARGLSTDNEPKSTHPGIERRVRFGEPLLDYCLIKAALRLAGEESGFELRKKNLAARRISLSVQWADGKENTRSITLSEPIALDTHITTYAETLLASLLDRRLHLLGFALRLLHLEVEVHTIDLFDVEDELKQQNLQAAVDRIRTRYGVASLSRSGATYGK